MDAVAKSCWFVGRMEMERLIARERTRQVKVGDVPLGGGAPVVVQSMLNAAPDDAAANLEQIEALAEVGCELVRIAIPVAGLPSCASIPATSVGWRPPVLSSRRRGRRASPSASA